ncbi:MAG: S1C family serine protease [Gammaproteobacteria bacterium]|jgi:serine protease DegS
MNLWHKAVIFLAGSLVGGLAIAFLAVAWRPELLADRLATRQAAAAAAAAGATAPEDGTAAGPGAASTPGDPAAAEPASPVRQAPLGSYAEAVRKAAPAVVNVYAARIVTERLPRNLLQDPFGELGPRYRQRLEQSLGSGVIVDPSGQVVTNHHVIANAAAIRVQLADGREADATVIGRDPDTDLALLRIGLRDLPAIELGRSSTLRVGDVVLAIGNPIGLSASVTQGIVSATGRGQLGVAVFENFIQTDAPINVGNSGGALINTRGELVGINTAIVARNLGVEGIGFAIPVDLVRGVTGELVARGRVVRGWVGFSVEYLDEDRARAFGLPRGGIMVTRLFNGSPAAQAGLKLGDVITAVGGRAPTSAQEVQVRIAATPPGTALIFGVARGDLRDDVTLQVIEQPQGAQQAQPAGR